MATINEILDSGESVNALEAAMRATPEGAAALDAAIAAAIALRDTPKE